MSNASRVKILDSKYDEDRDLIIWSLRFVETGDEQSFCWPSVDLISSLGINPTKLQPEHIHKFCSDMLGKELNFVVEGLPQSELPNPDKEIGKEISEGIADHFDTFRRMTTDGE